MNLDRARACLQSRFFLIPWLFGRYALACLSRSSDPDSIDILVDSLDSVSSQLRARIIGVLEATAAPPKTDRLWRLWAAGRQPLLGEILQRGGRAAEADDLLELSLLKLGRESQLPLGRALFPALVPYFADPDPDVAGACRRYLRRVRDRDPKEGLYLQLLRRAYDEIGVDRQSVQAVLPLFDEPEAVPLVRAYLGQLPTAMRDYANLLSGQLANLSFDPQQPAALIPFLSDADPDVRRHAGRFFADLRQQQPEYWVLATLRRGLPEQLPTDARTIRQALPQLEHPDPLVETAVQEYIAGLPRTTAVDEVCFAVWLRRDSARLLQALLASGRRPPSPAVDCLIALLEQDLDRYCSMNDDDGELFREAWLLAGAAQRQRLSTVVVHSRNEPLIAAYRKAMASRHDYDLDLHLRALCAAGLDEDLFALLQRLSLRQAFRLCRRWQTSGWRPDHHADLVDGLIAMLDEFVRTPAADAMPTPPGTRDLLAAWGQGVAPVAVDIARRSPDPVVRAGGLIRGVAEDILGDTAVTAARQSRDWLERLAAALTTTPFDVERDAVYWVDAALGNVAGLADMPAAADPDQFDAVKAQLQRLEGCPGGVLVARLRLLLRMLTRLHEHFCTEIAVTADDAPADVNAIAVEDAPEDLFA